MRISDSQRSITWVGDERFLPSLSKLEEGDNEETEAASDESDQSSSIVDPYCLSVTHEIEPTSQAVSTDERKTDEEATLLVLLRSTGSIKNLLSCQSLFPHFADCNCSDDSAPIERATDEDSQRVVPFGVKVVLLKSLGLAISILTWVDGFIVVEGAYVMITFSFWAVVLSTLNLLLSWFFSLRATCYNIQKDSVGNDQHDVVDEISQGSDPSRYQRLLQNSWLLSSSLAAHSGIASCLIYWPYVLTNTASFTTVELLRSVPAHGGLLLVVLFDAYAVNKISLRWSHWLYFILPYDSLYMIWTGIHVMAGIGNPEYSDNDPWTNDDAIYPRMTEWSQTGWKLSLSYTFLLVFMVGPLLFCLLKGMALVLSKLGSIHCRDESREHCPSRMFKCRRSRNAKSATTTTTGPKPPKKLALRPQDKSLEKNRTSSLRDNTAHTDLDHSGCFSLCMCDEEQDCLAVCKEMQHEELDMV